jgi:hypothetical protein
MDMADDGRTRLGLISGGGGAVETLEDGVHLDHNVVELERIKKECDGMINTLKALDAEEKRLRQGNQILAQHAVIMGCSGGFDAGARKGAGRKRPAPSTAVDNKSVAKRAAVPPKNTLATTQGTGASKNNSFDKGTAQPDVKRKCEQILSKLNQHGIFTNVTHPARIAEGFVDLTIHMRVIQKKIESNTYASSFELFKRDLRQMFESSLQASKEGCQFHDVIKELKKSYESALANVSREFKV